MAVASASTAGLSAGVWYGSCAVFKWRAGVPTGGTEGGAAGNRRNWLSALRTTRTAAA
jgi:hypothetical protein